MEMGQKDEEIARHKKAYDNIKKQNEESTVQLNKLLKKKK